jgi:hypothetical protein
VNNANCFAIDDAVLIARAGSQVLPDGDGIELVGVGRFKIGEQVVGGGGGGSVQEFNPSPEQRRCLADDSTGFVAVSTAD